METAPGRMPVRRMPQRTRSNFLTRTATDDASRLDRRCSAAPSAGEESQQNDGSNDPYEPATAQSEPLPRRHSLARKIFRSLDGGAESPLLSRRSSSTRRTGRHSYGSIAAEMHRSTDAKDGRVKSITSRPGAMPRPVGGKAKLGTFSGVFVPTSLNVLSILMFLRFGFILGQAGFIGMACMLAIAYSINFVTTLSLSAISTNGTVRGGGTYYLLSRSLGPEFGGSIGVVFYLGCLLNTSMNAVGLIDCIKQNFGETSGNWAQWLPEGFWWEYLWATGILGFCTCICLAGSGVFARCSNGLLALLLAATFSIPFSTIVVHPFRNPQSKIDYTGLSAQTFRDNLLPKFTRHAAGSRLHGRVTFQDLFGILFPATGGIFAGASMSGDLKHPSKAIPKGTLSGLALTFVAYALVVLAMAATITRPTLYNNINVIQDVNISGVLILLGEFATSFFSALMGVIGSAKLLQAVARDNLLPGFTIFGQGTKSNDEPTFAILLTYMIAQVAMLCDINQLASFVTMTYLATFLVVNFSCFLLKISSAPNFRPSFRYFNWWTALFGTLISGATMFFVDGGYATGCLGVLVILFGIIHYFTPPKSWGDVSQSLIYHQVRKYLLKLRQEHVKFWRPQILLFINNPRQQYKLIQFCNALKKGGLFILGHVIVTTDFGTAVEEARRAQNAWTRLIDFSRIKAFPNIATSPAVFWGARNLVLGAGLGGMRPNIIVMGFYNLEKFRNSQPPVDAPAPRPRKSAQNAGEREPKKKDNRILKPNEILPTDLCRTEGDLNPTDYLTILEDMLLKLQINAGIAKGFQNLEFPDPKGDNTKKYIDLWPIQMSADITSGGDHDKRSLLTTNFDTYTLILQLGCILDTVPAWKKVYRLRVAVFVEYESDVEEERSRVKKLLQNLRIGAEVLVFWLASGDVKSYQVIVNDGGATAGKVVEAEVDEVLKDEQWWQDVQKLRGKRGTPSAIDDLREVQGLLDTAPNWPDSSFRSSRQESNVDRFEGLRKLLQSPRRRASSSELGTLGVRPGMRTHRLHDDLVHRHASYGSASEESEDSDEDENSVLGKDSDGNISSRDGSGASMEISKLDDQSGVPRTASPNRLNRRRSEGDLLGDPFQTISVPQPDNLTATPSMDPIEKTGDSQSAEWIIKPTRPQYGRRPSAGQFSSRKVPETRVATEEGHGPSIMFRETNSPSGRQHQSIYFRNPSSDSHAASGFPFQQSVPLSFNDLPCRAQHLILNELMQQQSGDTAVVFTTLPSPLEGTCQSLDDSLSYLSDLEVLCERLPPVLLIHSNSMTVTMSL
ncbi:hypothetical protein MMC30_001081 [Trapelia coarctata]|nr:hypothetical protein [Trapelia coarctata]